MAFKKRDTIATGKPDKLKGNKNNPEINEVNKATRFKKGDKRLVGENNPNCSVGLRRNKDGSINKTQFNGAHLKDPNGPSAATRWKEGCIPKNKRLTTFLKEKGMDRITINEILANMLMSNPEEIGQIKADKETTMLELIGVAGLEAAQRGADLGRMDWFLEKILGKMPNETRNYNFNANVEGTISEDDNSIMSRAMKRTFSKEVDEK